MGSMKLNSPQFIIYISMLSGKEVGPVIKAYTGILES